MNSKRISLVFLYMALSLMLVESKASTAEPNGVVRLKSDGAVEPVGAHVENMDNVTYRLTSNMTESVIVEKNDIVLDGSGFSIEGSRDRDGIFVGGRRNVTIKNVKIENFSSGIRIFNSSNTSVLACTLASNQWGLKLESCLSSYACRNDVVANSFGVVFDSSNNNTLFENEVAHNEFYGIYFFNSDFCRIRGNNITGNARGIYFDYCSNNTIDDNNIVGNSYKAARLGYCNDSIIVDNVIASNLYGFWLFGSSSNTVAGNTFVSNHYEGLYLAQSSNNDIVRNNAEANDHAGLQLLESSDFNQVSHNNLKENGQKGVYMSNCSGNQFHHNNFISNMENLDVEDSGSNSWDDCEEGNYWSDYLGQDCDHDGIGDYARMIDAVNVDHYPLKGPIRSFKTDSGYVVDVTSNSTIGWLGYSEQEKRITLYILNSSVGRSSGFCRVCIQRELVGDELAVVVNEGQVPTINQNYGLAGNQTRIWIYFEYGSLAYEIAIIPESTSSLALILLFSVLSLAVWRKKVRNPRVH